LRCNAMQCNAMQRNATQCNVTQCDKMRENADRSVFLSVIALSPARFSRNQVPFRALQTGQWTQKNRWKRPLTCEVFYNLNLMRLTCTSNYTGLEPFCPVFDVNDGVEVAALSLSPTNELGVLLFIKNAGPVVGSEAYGNPTISDWPPIDCFQRLIRCQSGAKTFTKHSHLTADLCKKTGKKPL
jgi:hypothetical protein